MFSKNTHFLPPPYLTFFKTHYSVIFILHAPLLIFELLQSSFKKNKLRHQNSIHPYLLSKSFPFPDLLWSYSQSSNPDFNPTNPSCNKILLIRPTLKSYSSVLHSNPTHPSYTQVILIHPTLKSFSSNLYSNHTHLAHTQIILISPILKWYVFYVFFYPPLSQFLYRPWSESKSFFPFLLRAKSGEARKICFKLSFCCMNKILIIYENSFSTKFHSYGSFWLRVRLGGWVVIIFTAHSSSSIDFSSFQQFFLLPLSPTQTFYSTEIMFNIFFMNKWTDGPRGRSIKMDLTRFSF